MVKELSISVMMLTMNEKFELIPKYGGKYMVSKKGTIRSLYKKRNKFKQKNRNGYQTVMLYHNKSINVSVHRLVAEMFIPNPFKLPCVNHKDGNKNNPYVGNLEWVSYSDNAKHAYRLGLKKGYCKSKLTNEQIAQIRILSKQGYSTRKIASMFLITAPYVSALNLGKYRL